jgi:hypothetical protein
MCPSGVTRGLDGVYSNALAASECK